MVFAGKEKIIAIIPARGGSKRILRKNARKFCGKPILSYSISAARDSGLFDEVMVSTDDEEIAAIAEFYGASVPFFRSADGASDYATTTDVLLEVIGAYQKRGREFSQLCCIYPTAPFVTAQKLKLAYQRWCESGVDALVPVVPFSYPPLRGLVIQEDRLKMKWPEYEKARSQDLGEIYHDCGQFYFIKTSVLLQEKTLFCKNLAPMVMPEIEVQDIDNEVDWKLAEQKYVFLTKHELI